MGIPKGGVAFFDSGIGGLTVLAACRARLPHTHFYYFGDNARAPYGNLPTDRIKRYAFAAFDRLARFSPKAAVVACNTVTAVCIEELRKRYPFPIIGAEPAVFPAGALGGESFVLATRATCESARFRRLCMRVEDLFPGSRIRICPCDGLAGAIERGLKKGEDFTPYLPVGSPRSVVLGCTHYAYIKEQIEGFYRCPVVDGNDGIARRLQAVLERLPQRGDPPSTTDDHFLSQREGKVAEPPSKICLKKGEIFFVGGRKNQNKRIYEQMFVDKVDKKG